MVVIALYVDLVALCNQEKCSPILRFSPTWNSGNANLDRERERRA